MSSVYEIIRRRHKDKTQTVISISSLYVRAMAETVVGLHRHLYAAGEAGALHSTCYIDCCAPDVVVRLTDRNHSRHYRAVVDPCQKVAVVL